MIGYCMAPSGGTHTLRRKGFAAVREFLERCTDCTGADELRTTRDWRAPPLRSTLDASSALARDASDLTLRFDFLLKDPASGAVLPYRGEHFPFGWSNLLVFVRAAKVSFYATLFWPYETITPEIVRCYDAIHETMGIRLSPGKFGHAHPTKTGKRVLRRFTFDRASYQAPRDDRSVALLAALAADPRDVGPRLAYADWLIEHGDPLGELIVVEHRHAELAADDPRRSALGRRRNALWRKHARAWRRLPFVGLGW